jgi:hypothetical protein
MPLIKILKNALKSASRFLTPFERMKILMEGTYHKLEDDKRSFNTIDHFGYTFGFDVHNVVGYDLVGCLKVFCMKNDFEIVREFNCKAIWNSIVKRWLIDSENETSYALFINPMMSYSLIDLF